jgi:CBS domain containing-hemolysin-like protein
MLFLFFLAVGLTLSVSALCSVLEAMILSTRRLEVEKLCATSPKAGRLLRLFREDLEGTIAAVLTVNTVANTAGSIMVGVLATRTFGDLWLGVISALMTLGILFFSEIIPKNIGVLYRTSLQPFMVFPLYGIYLLAAPLTNLTSWVIRKILRRPEEPPGGEEIMMLAEREVRAKRMSQNQMRLLHSALSLEQTKVGQVMTPRRVVTTVEADETVAEVVARLGKLRFGRMPVTGESPDDIIGVVRRRDLLPAMLKGQGERKVSEFMQEPVIVPEVGHLSAAMELLVAKHQQLALVVDEFGGFAGVVTLEDLFEFFIGREFYETDDVAVDMQELAKRQSRLRGAATEA